MDKLESVYPDVNLSANYKMEILWWFQLLYVYICIKLGNLNFREEVRKLNEQTKKQVKT